MSTFFSFSHFLIATNPTYVVCTLGADAVSGGDIRGRSLGGGNGDGVGESHGEEGEKDRGLHFGRWCFECVREMRWERDWTIGEREREFYRNK